MNAELILKLIDDNNLIFLCSNCLSKSDCTFLTKTFKASGIYFLKKRYFSIRNIESFLRKNNFSDEQIKHLIKTLNLLNGKRRLFSLNNEEAILLDFFVRIKKGEKIIFLNDALDYLSITHLFFILEAMKNTIKNIRFIGIGEWNELYTRYFDVVYLLDRHQQEKNISLRAYRGPKFHTYQISFTSLKDFRKYENIPNNYLHTKNVDKMQITVRLLDENIRDLLQKIAKCSIISILEIHEQISDYF